MSFGLHQCADGHDSWVDALCVQDQGLVEGLESQQQCNVMAASCAPWPPQATGQLGWRRRAAAAAGRWRLLVAEQRPRAHCSREAEVRSCPLLAADPMCTLLPRERGPADGHARSCTLLVRPQTLLSQPSASASAHTRHAAPLRTTRVRLIRLCLIWLQGAHAPPVG